MQQGRGARVVLTCVGSLGDLHPYLALALELARRGHVPVVATLETFRAQVTGAGLQFHPLRAVTTETASTDLIRRVFHGRKGVEYIVRQLILPALHTALADTLDAADGADLLIAHPLTFATRLVAEARGLPWISTQLAPTSMLSIYDPPVLPDLGWVHRLRPAPAAYRLFFALAERSTRSWFAPYLALCREMGVVPPGNPLFAAGHSPVRDLALFSQILASPQPDWPAQTVATGFPFFAQPAPPNPELERWLASGPPPVIFTLGSSAVMDPGSFFTESAEAARQMGKRALLLGAEPAALPGQAETEHRFACRYAAYAEVFPQGAAVVHQGGIGTMAEVLRAARPMLVVPFGVDQPDNAARAQRLGVARVLGRGQYRAARVARELRPLLEDARYARRAAEVGALILGEQGTARACDAIEAVLRPGGIPH